MIPTNIEELFSEYSTPEDQEEIDWGEAQGEEQW